MPKAPVFSCALERAANCAGRPVDGPAHPLARSLRVRQRLDGGEGLRRDDDQGRGGVEILRRIRPVRAIHVRDEVAPRAIVERGEGQHGHRGSEVRAADADVHHVGDPSPLPLERAVAHVRREAAHAVQRLADAGHDVGPVDDDRSFAPQRGMQHGTILGRIDARAGEHRVAPCRHVGGHLQQQVQRLDRQRGLGQIVEERPRPDPQPRVARLVLQQIRDALPRLRLQRPDPAPEIHASLLRGPSGPWRCAGRPRSEPPTGPSRGRAPARRAYPPRESGHGCPWHPPAPVGTA